jgi:hypothetical protein
VEQVCGQVDVSPRRIALKKLRTSRPSPAMIIAVIALVFALIGS